MDPRRRNEWTARPMRSEMDSSPACMGHLGCRGQPDRTPDLLEEAGPRTQLSLVHAQDLSGRGELPIRMVVLLYSMCSAGTSGQSLADWPRMSF